MHTVTGLVIFTNFAFILASIVRYFNDAPNPRPVPDTLAPQIDASRAFVDAMNERRRAACPESNFIGSRATDKKA